MNILFGPWDRLFPLRVGTIEIQPLTNARQVLAELKAHPRYSQGWLYPPLSPPVSDFRPDAPLIPVTAYGLPPTHELRLSGPLATDSFADFAIALIGLVDGVRLTRDGWSHFYKSPLELHKLTDISAGPNEIVEIVRLGAEFWPQLPDEVCSRLFGAIHWLQFSSLLEHDFERFAGAYSALDTLYWVHRAVTGGAPVSHTDRPSVLAQYYGVPTPPWALVSGNRSRLANLRNELVHEARYAGAPTGFSHPDDYPMISTELGHFVARLLFSMLRIPCGYVATRVDSRAMHGLDLMGPLQAV